MFKPACLLIGGLGVIYVLTGAHMMFHLRDFLIFGVSCVLVGIGVSKG
jgi:hypothetical protein